MNDVNLKLFTYHQSLRNLDAAVKDLAAAVRIAGEAVRELDPDSAAPDDALALSVCRENEATMREVIANYPGALQLLGLESLVL